MNFPTLVMDNGASSIKIGWASGAGPVKAATATSTSVSLFEELSIKVLPNFVAKCKSERRRPFVSSQINDCRDSSGLFLILPFQKGYMCRPDTQKTVWDYVFSSQCQSVQPPETNLIITEPLLNFYSTQEAMCEILFEEYGFNGICRTTAPHMIDYYHGRLGPAMSSPCSIVVDSGHSFTHVIPFINGQKVTECIRRIDVGGKALTNHLKEIISYRQLHVLDEFYLMNQVKEDVCYVSSNFTNDVELSRKRLPGNTILREYVLPNYMTVQRGYLRSQGEIGTRASNDDQILRLNTERFAVPELIFHPSDVGINQMGLSESILSVIGGFPDSLQPHFLRNIFLAGGSSQFPGLRERVYSDIRSGTLNYHDVNVISDSDPVTLAWRGGNAFASDPEFNNYLVSRKQYQETGVSAYAKKSDV